MKNELVRINVPDANILINRYRFPKQAGIKLCDLHYHDEIELIVITSGTLVATVAGEQKTYEAGKTLFFSPRIPHITYTSAEGGSYILIQFRLEHYLNDDYDVGKYFRRFINNAEIPFAVLQNAELSRLAELALTEENERRDGYTLFVKGLIYAIIALLNREGALALYNTENSAEIRKLRPAIAYIDDNFAKNITLDEIAEVQKLNPSYFCRLFKRASGQSFIDYLNFLRICKSEKLLAQKDRSILDVAYDVGFSSISYYNRVFKRYKHCTPTEYRRALNENN